MIKPSGASSFLCTEILRQVKTSNTTLIPDELALLLSSSFSFNQQFSHLGISCRVLLTLYFLPGCFPLLSVCMPTFRWALLPLVPAQPSGNHTGFLPTFQLLGHAFVGGHMLASTLLCWHSFFLSLLFFLSSFRVYWEIGASLPLCLLFLVCPGLLENAQIHLDTISMPQMSSLGNAVGIYPQNNISKCFWNEIRSWRHILIQGIILKSNHRWRFAKIAITMMT